jgi:hypothetical protein
MANVKISALPSTTATTLNDWVIKNDSGETTTNKVQLRYVTGLQQGVGSRSLKSANFLTPNVSSAGYLGAVAIGDGANADGEYSVALGTDIQSAGGQRDHYVAIGGVVICAQESIAVGYDNQTASAYAVGVGHRIRLFSDYGVAIGDDVDLKNYKPGQIGIGYRADMNSDYGVGIGYEVNVDGAQSVSIGYLSQARDIDSVSIGRQSQVAVGATYGIALGSTTNVNNQWGIAIGRDADVDADYGISIGGETNVTGATAVALGHQAQGNAGGGVSLGYQATTNHTNAVALGPQIQTDYANTTKTRSVQSTGQFFNAVQQLGSGTTFNINWNDGGSAEFTLTGDSTCIMTGVRDGGIYRAKITTTGAQTLTPSASGFTFVYQGGGFTFTPNGTDLCILHVFGTEIMVTHFADFS